VATLDWAQVVILGLVATVGFTLLSYGYSLWMAKRNVSYQVRHKTKQKETPPKSP
jgi:hypothetical protein